MPMTPDEARSLRARQANEALAARVGVRYDPVEHRPWDARPMAPAPQPEHTQESGPNASASLAKEGAGWRPAQTRLTQRRTDLNLVDQEQMQRLALKLMDSNPLAARLIKRMVNYVLGEGVKVQAKHEKEETQKKIQEVIDRFWSDHRNAMDARLPKMIMGLRAFGELSLHLTVNPANGFVRYAVISPFQVVGVYTEEEDVDQVDWVAVGRLVGYRPVLLKAVKVDERGDVQKEMTVVEMAKAAMGAPTAGPAAVAVARAQEPSRVREAWTERLTEISTVPDAKGEMVTLDWRQWAAPQRLLEIEANYDPDQTDALNFITFVRNAARKGAADDTLSTSPAKGKSSKIPRRRGDALYFGANTLTGMVRGRSDLLPLADIIDAYDRLMWLHLERRGLLSAFVWDITITGATQQNIDDWVAKNPPPEPGSMRAHNEREVWNAVAPDLKAQDEATASDLFLGYIGAGAGYPKTWLGANDDTSAAGAVEAGTPTMRDLTALQREVRNVITEIMRFVIDSAVLYGDLEEDLETDCFEVLMPDLSVTEAVKSASTLQAVATALLALKQAGNIIDDQTIQEVVANLLPALGSDADLKTIRERLDTQKAEDEKAQAEMGAYGLGGPGYIGGFGQGQGGPPGKVSGKAGALPLQQAKPPTTPGGQPRQRGQGDARSKGANSAADTNWLAKILSGGTPT